MSIKTIPFKVEQVLKQNIHYWGRNRTGECHGIEIMDLSGHKSIQITPITGFDKVTTGCYLQIPGDPVVLREIARHLLLLADRDTSKSNSK